jgi:chromosome segregation ATPase
MGRRTISELQDQLDAERADNERLYTKVENLRSEIEQADDDVSDVVAELESDSDDSDSDDGDDSDLFSDSGDEDSGDSDSDDE